MDYLAKLTESENKYLATQAQVHGAPLERFINHALVNYLMEQAETPDQILGARQLSDYMLSYLQTLSDIKDKEEQAEE